MNKEVSEVDVMIGQMKFAWIGFRRSFLASMFSFISQIITYSAITISIAIFSIVKPFLNWSVNSVFYKSYVIMGILFITVSIVIGAVVTARSIDLKFMSQKDDIAIMKNAGGKNKWIYSYFIFNQIITSIIMLLVGIVLALILLAIIFYSFKFSFFFNHIRFIPVLGANIAILIVSYLKSHYTIIKFIEEKNFEVSSSRLSSYKSIFEFNGLLSKFKAVRKLASKNYLRSGKILASFLFSFFLAFSSISFALGPVAIAETYNHYLDNRFYDSTYVIGQEGIINFYSSNFGAQEYVNESYISELEDINFFKNRSFDISFLNDIDSTGVDAKNLFLTKLDVQEVAVLDITPEGYLQVGSNRTFYATVIGYQETNIFDELLLWGSLPSSSEVVIGDSLDNLIFENSTMQKIELTENSSRYGISSVALDVFASGFTVYVPLSKLNSESISNGPNLILLEDLNSTTYSIIASLVETNGYLMREISEIREENIKEYDNFSYMFDTLGLILFSIFTFQIIVFAFLYYLTYKKDYELLYKLGIEKKKISKINVNSILMQLVPGILFGSYFGSIITRYFLVPYTKLGYYLAFLFGITVWFTLAGYIGATMASRKGLKQIYDSLYKNKIIKK